MAKTRQPKNNDAQDPIRQSMESIANTATRSEKVSFDRKMDNMVTLMASLKPIEDQILSLVAKKQPIIDEITDLRAEMVQTCVHPYTHLTTKEDTTHCKFCNRTFKILKHD